MLFRNGMDGSFYNKLPTCGMNTQYAISDVNCYKSGLELGVPEPGRDHPIPEPGREHPIPEPGRERIKWALNPWWHPTTVKKV